MGVKSSSGWGRAEGVVENQMFLGKVTFLF